MGRRHNTHVHSHRFRTAYTIKALLLQGPQQLNLRFSWHIADFIQKQSSLMSFFEQARLAFAIRSGKGASLIAKKFALKKAFRNPAAIDGHKSASTAACLMQCPRKELFAATAFPSNQHWRRRGGYAPSHGYSFLDTLTMPVNRSKGIHRPPFYALLQGHHFFTGAKEFFI